MASAAAAATPQHPAGLELLAKAPKPVLTIDASNLPKPASATPNFMVPTILITPPDAPPSYSCSVPEQQYEKSVLFVPVKTEELGWDEHGLYWNGTYAYPIHQIYDKEGQPIGRRRKGPHGYRFEEYYHNKTPRRSALASSSSSSLSTTTSAAAAEDTVEEACVRLEEPAPARVESLAKTVPTPEVAMEEDELSSPLSPTLSAASDSAETEDSSSVGDDSNSLWSRCDDAESSCTSPGTMSPPHMDVDSPEPLQAEKLSRKLSSLSAAEDNRISKTAWLSLGTLPSTCSSVSTLASRSQSLPTARSGRGKPEMDMSHTYRATSSMIVDAQHRESRRHSSPSAYASIIEDLTTSPFASSSSSTSKVPSRAATLPRAPSRSAYAQSRSSVLRPPPQHASYVRSQRSSSTSASSSSVGGGRESLRRFHDVSSGFEPDFAAGWTFENPTSAPMSNVY
ncbi:hypothetical protein EX895_001227 [Sporisorium graminicola]|uniref:Uncharacterized protein n=1 Tax=Sporisorium graminicola TaxID=280036 RepID=A0A4V6EUE4_9BASI|nr:hypothetical protein EX895_001227 [Sporisorium graminicola]TKY89929.1 hypothetical protein EX895_001227 [Sporisorium graminicola]